MVYYQLIDRLRHTVVILLTRMLCHIMEKVQP